MRRNYYRKLWGEIITENYDLVYQSRGKCEIYRDTGVSKNMQDLNRQCLAFIEFKNILIFRIITNIKNFALTRLERPFL